MMNNDVIVLQTWWMGELQNLTKKVMEQEEKRQKKAKAANEKKMGDYKTFADIQDAYGMGMISEKKRDRLYDLLEQSQPEPDRLYESKLALLAELYEIAKGIVRDNMS